MVALGSIKYIQARHDEGGNSLGASPIPDEDARADEASPLLSDRESADPDIPTQINLNQNLEPSLSTSRLILLCLGMIGLQLAWAAELSNGSPFLLSLGMSKSLLAIVWIAGPLAGVLVQPIVGIWSDNCQLAWGRRRPFLLAGAVLTAVSLMSLSWTRDIVHSIVKIFGGNSENTNLAAQAWAVFWIYILDFAVNVLQAALRAFIVDIAPTHQQDDANAWASRLNGFANIIGYVMSYSHLPKLLPFFGNTQLKVLCAVGSIALIVTVGISLATTPEKNPKDHWPSSSSTIQKIGAFLKVSFTAFTRLPTQTQRVCFTQFFNWIGWFPFLFYISTYIGQLHVNPIFESHPDATKEEIDKAWDDGTRLGGLALLIFAITSLTGNAFFPFMLQPLAESPPSSSRTARLLARLQIPGLTMTRAWMISLLFFAVCMWSTLFIRKPGAGIVMSGCVGFCWSMTNWAPYALIAADISQRDREKRNRQAKRGPQTHIALQDEPDITDETDIDQPGIVLGLHNVAISAPQILATLIASVIFNMTQEDRGVANDDSIGHVLRFGGIAALIAAWATSRIVST